MKRFSEAIRTLDEAKKLDLQGAHTAEIREMEYKCQGATRNMTQEEVAENARKDPEVMEILADPIMRSILEQMKSDPKAVAEYVVSDL